MKHQSLVDERPDLLLQWSTNNELNPNNISACSHKKALWICDKGHLWSASKKTESSTIAPVLIALIVQFFQASMTL